MKMANVIRMKKKIVNGCCWNFDTLLHRFVVQQQTVAVIPAVLACLQPFVPPKHHEMFVVAIRPMITLPEPSIFDF